MDSPVVDAPKETGGAVANQDSEFESLNFDVCAFSSLTDCARQGGQRSEEGTLAQG